MPSLNEIAQNIVNTFRGGRSTNNEHISLAQVKFQVLYYRALLIRRDAQRRAVGRAALYGYAQDLPRFKMKLVESEEGYQPSSFESGNALAGLRFIARSEQPLGALVRTRGSEGITELRGGPGDAAIPVTKPQAARYASFNKYTARSMRGYILPNGFLCVTQGYFERQINEIINADLFSGDTSGDSTEEESLEIPDILSEVYLRAVFEDPYHGAALAGKLITHDQECPAFPMDLVQRVTQSIMNAEGRMIAGSKNDAEIDRLPDNA